MEKAMIVTAEQPEQCMDLEITVRTGYTVGPSTHLNFIGELLVLLHLVVADQVLPHFVEGKI